MVNVWAHAATVLNQDLVGFNTAPTNGWDYVINFRTLGHLLDQLHDLGILGSIQTLAINSHGTNDNEILLDRIISPRSTLGIDFDNWFSFRGLGQFLASTGHLWFTGCLLARGDGGTELLRLISRRLPGRVIIGHDVQTSNHGGMGMSDAGVVTIPHVPSFSSSSAARRISKYNIYCKWVCDGTVLKYPAEEQRRRPRMTCAYPECPGHSDESHQCDGKWHPRCEWRGRIATPYLDPTLEALGRGGFREPRKGGSRRIPGPIGTKH